MTYVCLKAAGKIVIRYSRDYEELIFTTFSYFVLCKLYILHVHQNTNMFS